MSNPSGWVMLVVGVLGVAFFGFKIQQTEGKDRMNELSTDLGGGSFFKSVFLKIMWLIYVILGIASIGLVFVGWGVTYG